MAGVCGLLAGCAGLRSSRDDGEFELPGDRADLVLPPQVTPFSASPADGRVPQGWYPYIVRRDKGRTQYVTVADAGRTVLRARAPASSTALHCPVDIDPASSPWLEWAWKVDALEPRASVADDHRDDAAVRVFVAVDGDTGRFGLRDFVFYEQVELFTGKRLPYATLMYVWDPGLPVGTVVDYPRSSRIRYLVVESGPARLGQWTHYRRNIEDDYRQVFGEPPGRVCSVGVLTDSDDLRSTTEVLYGDVSLLDR